MVNSAKGLGINRVRLWPKAVDTELFHPDKKSSQMRHRLTDGEIDKPLMVYVGRLSFEKRLEWLYAPITNIPGIRLAFVGSGPAEDALRERFAGTDTVFTGYMAGEDLAAAYASADVFAFPSDTETLGFVAFEAHASGVPVVGARAGGVPDVVKHGENGFLFTPGDLGELTEHLRTLLFDKALAKQFGDSGRATAEQHSWRASTEKLVHYYRAAIQLHHRFDPASKR